MSSPVLLGKSPATTELTALATRAVMIGDDIKGALELALEIGDRTALPGSGRTLDRWELLATLGAADLTVARVVEPHLDALAILGEADSVGMVSDLAAIGAGPDSSWGVFAAEGPGAKLTATRHGHGWSLSGVKPWCSLAGDLSHALVTAHTEQGRALFAIALRSGDVSVEPDRWVARGLSKVASGPITLDRVTAVPVGPPLWYLERPGFAWGGIGVAAVWLGGAIGVGRRLYDKCRERPDDVIGLVHLGAVDLALYGSAQVLGGSAGAIDGDEMDLGSAGLLAARVRGVVAEAVETTLTRAGHALGPGPLALEDAHARRVADLQLYVRQHHAERDHQALGSSLVNDKVAPW